MENKGNQENTLHPGLDYILVDCSPPLNDKTLVPKVPTKLLGEKCLDIYFKFRWPERNGRRKDKVILGLSLKNYFPEFWL